MLGDSERASVFWDGLFWGTAHLVNKKRTPQKKKKNRSGRQLVLGDSERASVFWDGLFWGTAHLVNKKGPHKKKAGQADSLCLETASEPVCFGMASFGEQPT